jgi:hypothetical protein
MEGKLSLRGSFLGGPEMELPERRRKGSYLGRWWESYFLRDEGAMVLGTDGEGCTREPHRESYLRLDGEGATLEECRGSYLVHRRGWRVSYLEGDGGVATWVGRTQISSLRC